MLAGLPQYTTTYGEFVQIKKMLIEMHDRSIPCYRVYVVIQYVGAYYREILRILLLNVFISHAFEIKRPPNVPHVKKKLPIPWRFQQQEPQQREFKDWIKLWMVKNPWTKDLSSKKAMGSVPMPQINENQVAMV